MRKIFSLRAQKLCLATGLLAFIVLGGFSSVQAADSPTSGGAYALRAGMNEFGFWLGGSPDTAQLIGTVEDRQLLLLALRYGRILQTWDAAALEYTLDLYPAVVYFEPSNVRRGSSTIYGAGLSPIGLKLNFAPQSWLQPFVAASVGFVYFTHDVPVPSSSRFNFTPELGLGLQFFIAPKRALTIGYKLHHISNANTGHSNPGMDSHVIYAGFSFFTP
jgi:opacity protein-like surface antigen